MVTVRRTLLAFIALALVGAPAMADTLFRREDGTNVVLYEAAREMRINGVAGGFSSAMPLAAMPSQRTIYTPHTLSDTHECTRDLAHCVQYDFPSGGPNSLTYKLSDTSAVVRCAPEG